MTHFIRNLLLILALVCVSDAQAQDLPASLPVSTLQLQPDTCVRLQQHEQCQLTLSLTALPQHASKVCIYLKQIQQPGDCVPLSANPIQQLTLQLQQDVLLKVFDSAERILAIGEIKVVTFKPVTTSRRKRGLGWNLL